MHFLPSNQLQHSVADHPLWDLLKEALKHFEGTAWPVLPFSPETALKGALILNPRHGLLLIGCLSIREDQIESIQGPVWFLQDPQTELQPVLQLVEQKSKILELLKTHLGEDLHLQIQVMVALPEISRDEWLGLGHSAQFVAPKVLFKENLTAQGLLSWMNTLQGMDPPVQASPIFWQDVQQALQSQLENEFVPEPSAALRSVLEQKTPPAPQAFRHTHEAPRLHAPQLIFVEHEHTPPSASCLSDLMEVPTHLQNSADPENRDYWYLVATAGLERERFDLAPKKQVVEDVPDGQRKQHLLFRRAMQLFLKQDSHLKVAHRLDEVVYLQRAIMQLTAKDEEFKGQVKADVFAWLDAFHEVEERGLDLSLEQPDHSRLFVHHQVKELLGTLQKAYRQQIGREGRLTFERALHHHLASKRFSPPPLVVLEGFTRLTPLQERFIQACLEHPHCTVVILVPFADEQVEGFEALGHTYCALRKVPHRVQRFSRPTLKAPWPIEVLQRHLFGEDPPIPPAHDGSVHLSSHPTQQQEAGACIDRIAHLLDEDRAANRRRSIAIVTRDPKVYCTLLRDEASVRHPELKPQFDLQNTQLLLTPVGRFVLGLYQVWREGNFTLEADIFSALLASGWLGRRAQASASRFESLVCSHFATLTAYTSWERVLENLLNALPHLPSTSRLPLRLLSLEDLHTWQRALKTIHGMVVRLFDGHKRTLGEHVRHLKTTLIEQATGDTTEAEKAIVENIMRVLEEFSSSSDLDMHTEEFEQVLSALVQDRESQENTRLITITGPESLDGISKDIVFYLGVDEHRVPYGYREPWPFVGNDIGVHHAQERYLFLAVVRSVRQELHLSYAQTDDRQGCGPSLYLEQVADVLGQTVENLAHGKSEPPHLPTETGAPLPQVTRSSYTLEEIAQYRVCPQRYRLERLTPQARPYRDPWHMPFLAQGVWFEHALGHIYREGVLLNQHQLIGAFLNAVDHTLEDVKTVFPAFQDEDWFFIRHQVLQRARYQAGQHKSRTNKKSLFAMRQRQPLRLRVRVGETERTILAGTRWMATNTDNTAITDPTFYEEWLLAASRSGPGMSPPSGQHRHQVQQWWRRTQQHALEQAIKHKTTHLHANAWSHEHHIVGKSRQDHARLQDVVHELEHGDHPALPGEHCKYCPVRGLCLGKSQGESA